MCAILKWLMIGVGLVAPNIGAAEQEISGDALRGLMRDMPIACLRPDGAECTAIINYIDVNPRGGAYALIGLFAYKPDQWLRITLHGDFIFDDGGICIENLAHDFRNADMVWAATQSYEIGEDFAELHEDLRAGFAAYILEDFAIDLDGVTTCLRVFTPDGAVGAHYIQRVYRNQRFSFEEAFSAHSVESAEALTINTN